MLSYNILKHVPPMAPAIVAETIWNHLEPSFLLCAARSFRWRRVAPTQLRRECHRGWLRNVAYTWTCASRWLQGTLVPRHRKNWAILPNNCFFLSALVGISRFHQVSIFSLVVSGVHFYGDCLIDRFSDFSSGFNKGRSNRVTCRAGWREEARGTYKCCGTTRPIHFDIHGSCFAVLVPWDTAGYSKSSKGLENF